MRPDPYRPRPPYGPSGCQAPAPPQRGGHACACECHGSVTLHLTLTCDCGRPVTPPKRECCPPEVRPQPGTVDLPQPDPPPVPGKGDVPPWREGRPPKGDPGEGPWFTGVVGSVQRKGPRFGPRRDEFLPYLLVRSSAGDRGARPLSGVFWESPDIFVTPNQSADTAPLMPPTAAGVAQAGAPNTLYAHVWNLGKSPAYRVRVEFYWFNPTLGISRADANLIGAAWVDLANRFTLSPTWQRVTGSAGGDYISRGCHAVVRCPVTWIPAFENGGHECLVVRVFEPMLDGLAFAQFSAAADRHVAQRNIAVVQAQSPAAIDLNLSLGWFPHPGEAEIDVETAAPGEMEWLKLYRGDRNAVFGPPAVPVVSGVLPAGVAGTPSMPLSGIPADARAHLLRPRERFKRGCDPLAVGFHASVADLRPDQAQVLRVRQRLDGDLVGGYSVVLVGAR
jgi:hypothetical protein